MSLRISFWFESNCNGTKPYRTPEEGESRNRLMRRLAQVPGCLITGCSRDVLALFRRILRRNFEDFEGNQVFRARGDLCIRSPARQRHDHCFGD